MEAIFPYEATDPVQLSLAVGDRLLVLCQPGDSPWWVGYKTVDKSKKNSTKNACDSLRQSGVRFSPTTFGCSSSDVLSPGGSIIKDNQDDEENELGRVGIFPSRYVREKFNNEDTERRKSKAFMKPLECRQSVVEGSPLRRATVGNVNFLDSPRPGSADSPYTSPRLNRRSTIMRSMANFVFEGGEPEETTPRGKDQKLAIELGLQLENEEDTSSRPGTGGSMHSGRARGSHALCSGPFGLGSSRPKPSFGGGLLSAAGSGLGNDAFSQDFGGHNSATVGNLMLARQQLKGIAQDRQAIAIKKKELEEKLSSRNAELTVKQKELIKTKEELAALLVKIEDINNDSELLNQAIVNHNNNVQCGGDGDGSSSQHNDVSNAVDDAERHVELGHIDCVRLFKKFYAYVRTAPGTPNFEGKLRKHVKKTVLQIRKAATAMREYRQQELQQEKKHVEYEAVIAEIKRSISEAQAQNAEIDQADDDAPALVLLGSGSPCGEHENENTKNEEKEKAQAAEKAKKKEIDGAKHAEMLEELQKQAAKLSKDILKKKKSIAKAEEHGRELSERNQKLDAFQQELTAKLEKRNNKEKRHLEALDELRAKEAEAKHKLNEAVRVRDAAVSAAQEKVVREESRIRSLKQQLEEFKAKLAEE